MLHIKLYITATGYSKVLRGLRFPLGFAGLHTSRVNSGDTSSGQCKSRYAIHARRHSNDKVFRYLKRIIVIPAVYQSLAPLDGSFGYWHWADVAFHTLLCSLAECCVFVKQSDLPSHCTL